MGDEVEWRRGILDRVSFSLVVCFERNGDLVCRRII